MNVRMKTALAAVAALALTTVGPVASTQASGHQVGHGSKAAKVYTLVPSTPGNNPEGVAWDRRSRSFFVGTVGTGTIYRATLRGHTLRPFITPDPADPADSAIGMKVSGASSTSPAARRAASTSTGSEPVRCWRASKPEPGGFLNDLVVTRRGHVYVTDSFRPILWHVTPRMLRAGSGTPRRINVEPEIAYEPGQFNVNGIVSRRGGRELIVVSSFSQSLYRIRLHAPNGPRGIRKIHAPKLAGRRLADGPRATSGGDRGPGSRDGAEAEAPRLARSDRLGARPPVAARTVDHRPDAQPLPGGQRGLRHGDTAVHGLLPGSPAPLTTGRSTLGVGQHRRVHRDADPVARDVDRTGSDPGRDGEPGRAASAS